MTELKIIATIIVKPEYQEELEKVFRTVVDETRKEKGNVSYDLHQDAKNLLKYTILETWRSQAAIDEHNESAHFKAFVDTIEGKIENLEIDVIKQIY